MFVIIWLALLVLLTIIQVIRSPGNRGLKGILEAFLLYLTVINIGLYGLVGFFANIFYPEETAQFMGWGSGSPFQYEVGIAYLAFALLGFLCIWERGDFWLATIIGFSVFLFGMGLGHIKEFSRYHDNDVMLYMHLILPPCFLLLMMIYRRLGHADSVRR